MTTFVRTAALALAGVLLALVAAWLAPRPRVRVLLPNGLRTGAGRQRRGRLHRNRQRAANLR